MFLSLTSFIGPPLNVEFKRRYDLDDATVKTAVATFREYYNEKGVYENILYPGVREMLEGLSEAGIVIGSASSKPQPLVETLMDHFEIRKYFRAIVGSDPADELNNVNSNDSKITAVKKSLRLLGDPDPMRVAMVGDRRYDMAGALHTGCLPVGAGYGYAVPGELEEAGAAFVAANTNELLNYLIR